MTRKSLYLISDLSGEDDEGMKKIARKLYGEIKQLNRYSCELIGTAQIHLKLRQGGTFQFIGGPTWRTVFLAWALRWRRKNKTILTFSNPILSTIALWALKYMRPSLCICMDPRWEQKLLDLGLNVCRLNLAGVDLKIFVPVSEDRKQELRSKYGITANERVLLHVGHVKTNRGLEVFSNVAETRLYRCIVIGSSTTRTDAVVADALLADQCSVEIGYQPDIHEFYQLADCYVFPTVDHTAAVQIPLGVLEAIGCGLPVVTTPFGGLPLMFEGVSPACQFMNPHLLEDVLAKVDSAIQSTVSDRQKIRGRVQSWGHIATDLVARLEEL